MFDDLNPQQLAAATHGDGPLLVLAGAGTGKTTTLAARVAHLVASGVQPEAVLLLTFTRRAAAEMLSRAAHTAGEGARRVVGGTFHAVANRLLRRHAEQIGLRPDFSILDAGDAADLLDLVRDDLGVAQGAGRFPRKGTLAAILSRVANAREPLAKVVTERFGWCSDHLEGIAEVLRAYGARKREHHLLDYDDLLLHLLVLVSSAPGRGIGAAFRHVLVDEYQDTNALQVEVLRALRADDDRITAVGDDAQAIYSFRAADVAHILGFASDFPGATVLRLEHSYRSTQAVLDVANAVIAQAADAYSKVLWSPRTGPRPRLHTCHDEDDQSGRVCEAVLARREEGVTLTDIAVLFRAGHHSIQLELELARRGIPFVKYGGLRFLEAAHVKDLLALLRLVDNPDDEIAWFRILQRLEGVGPATARRLMAELGVGTGAALSRLAEGLPPETPPGARQDLSGLADALLTCREQGPSAVPAQVDRLVAAYTPVCRSAFVDPEPRLADLAQLAVLAGDASDLAGFVDDLVLDPPTSTGDLAGAPHREEEYLVLSTIHSAKGLEWDSVHLIHAADGMLPSDLATGDPAEVAEERRLLYVALTRAKRSLDVYFPLRYHHTRVGTRGRSDRHSYAQVSRFLQGAVASTLEPVGPTRQPADVPAGAPTAARTGGHVDAPAQVGELLERLLG